VSPDAHRPAARDPRRWWARLALVALLAAALGLLAILVRSRGGLAALAVAAAVDVAVVAAVAWWAFTTRRTWKRRLNLALAAVALVLLAAAVVVFGVRQAGELLILAAVGLAYVLAARRALGPAAGNRARPPGGGGPAPPARPWLLVNPRSGGGTAARLGLVEAARSRGLQVHLLAAGEEAAALARAAVAAGAGAIGMAGGDGSLGPVAAVAVEAGVPFVCVPAGTRNHFAHDLGLDRGDPLAALDAFGGDERRVDVGVVGGRVFLNNVSLGAYADLVTEPGYRAGKLATAHAVLPGALRGERAPLAVSFGDREGRRYQDAIVLLVANNRYDLQRPTRLGARDRLDDGVLQVSALRARTGAALAGLLARRAAGREPGPTWAQWTSRELRVDSQLAEIPAGLDGEAVVLRPPLEFRVLPRSLRVLLPPRLRPRRPALPGLLSRVAVRRLWATAAGRGTGGEAGDGDAGQGGGAG